MSRRDHSLLREIEREALNDAISLAATLRKCIALGAQTRNAELRDWAAQELNGYRDDSEIPQYRIIHAPLVIDGATFHYHVTGEQISTFDLPEVVREHITEEVKFAHGVGDLQALLRNTERSGETSVNLAPPSSAEAVKLMNYERSNQGAVVSRLYWSVSTARVEGVLDQIRTTLVRLVSEIRATMSDDASMPTPEQAAQAVNVVLHGGRRNQVTITTAQAGDGGIAHSQPAKERTESGWTRAQTVWTVIGVIVAIVGTYFTFRQWQG
ncbi:hypothetical protein AB0M79_28520 [Polymorphospora sp. NPDC051019]|uniref:AbiTii domain-containing protein n=1 Tax=Polymorphospora sp. NPDC051019 TaxID=3155725 RepID=UPI00342AD6C7